MAKLTEAQKLVRRVVKTAARDIIKQADAEHRRNSTKFTAHFHLDCTGPCAGHAFGYPIEITYPAYSSRYAALSSTDSGAK
jgi:hypothetical protein